ncbi:predicted protein [Uncinocarpus reesii 1704]|uniref:Homeobox domain-containing protein n=1 Tax=Uncinocarpus reesii (strain UAMH 1704) TaxID=336963 RepID=C4JQS1_UNCRE|nr:uncharacterized protein UREG_03403 [Uncinocarpus reesii 1704]EEP78557.1 predicted protein [Uncinocarpus reesii 1704]
MDYMNNPFAYGEHNVGLLDHPPIGYSVPFSFSQCNQPTDPYFASYHPAEISAFPGFYAHSGPFEDYDEYVENLSRPRLTKEQVETLEAQFQAQPKPTSNIKRQLAVQTNLTLPRVANWFQNRRAKEKQQKRQEEFKRMQAMKDSEMPKVGESSTSDGKETLSRTEGNQTVDNLTPLPTKSQLSTQNDCNSDSESRSGSSTRSHPTYQEDTSVSGQSCDSHGQSEKTNTTKKANGDYGCLAREDSVASEQYTSSLATDLPISTPSTWDVIHSSNASSTGNMDASQSSSSPQCDDFSSTTGWSQESSHVGKPLFRVSYNTCELPSELPKDSLYPNGGSFMESYPASEIPTFGVSGLAVSRQDTCPPDHIDHSGPGNHLESVSITEKSSEEESHGPKISPSNTSVFPHRRDKKLDLAARRKRPRPAAIGIGGPNRALIGPSSMSPTARTPSWGVSHSLRHAKSSQSLGSNLSPRYAGVRKVSAPLRSPLGMAASLDITGTSYPGADFMVPPLVATSMAPPTPLTPEGLQYLLPPTPNDVQYCLSPTDEMRCHRPFPVQHYIENQSPPRTPQPPNVLSQLHYQSLAPSLSASTVSTVYENYSLPISHDLMQNNLWTEPALVPGNISMPEIHMPKPTYISPVAHQSHFYGLHIANGEDLSTSFPSSPSQPTSSSLAQKPNAELLIKDIFNQQENQGHTTPAF